MIKSNKTTTPYLTHRTIRSFTLRQGRVTAAQQHALQTLWPVYGLTKNQGLLSFEQCFQRQAKTVLEIGFGNGDSLGVMAMAQPDVNFIGIEVYPAGVGALLQKISNCQLTNLRLYQEDACEVLATCVPENSLDKIQIFFPDPWPKKRHHKRRLIQSNFVALLRSRLKVGGQLHLATDWEDYAQHMVKVLAAESGWQAISSSEINVPLSERRVTTKFERRGERLGHQIYDLFFCKLDSVSVSENLP